MEHNDGTASKAEFARLRGVTPDCVSRWLRNGKISDKAIVGVGRNARIRVDVATKMVERRRLRIDNAAPDGDLAAARARVATAQAELLEMRLAREQGELVPRAAVQAADCALAQAIKRAFQGSVSWSEELAGAYQQHGLGALAALLRVRLTELNNTLADLLEAAAAEFEPPAEKGATNV